MSLGDWLRDLFGLPPRESDETVAALRAVRRAARSIECDEPIPPDAAETIHRVLRPDAWEDLMRHSHRIRR